MTNKIITTVAEYRGKCLFFFFWYIIILSTKQNFLQIPWLLYGSWDWTITLRFYSSDLFITWQLTRYDQLSTTNNWFHLHSTMQSAVVPTSLLLSYQHQLSPIRPSPSQILCISLLFLIYLKFITSSYGWGTLLCW